MIRAFLFSKLGPKKKGAFFILFCLLFLVSCEENNKQRIQEPESTSRSDSDKKDFSLLGSKNKVDDPHQRKVAQYNQYVACLNELQSSTSIPETYKIYSREIREAGKPGECPKYQLAPLFQRLLGSAALDKKIQICTTQLEKVSAGLYPQSQTALKELVQRLTELKNILQDSYDYFKLENFKDDRCAKAKELSKQTPPVFEALIFAAGNLSKSLGVPKKEISEHELATVEKKLGKKFDWQLRRFLIDLDDFMAQIRNDGKENYLKNYGVFAASAQAFSDYMAAHPEEVETYHPEYMRAPSSEETGNIFTRRHRPGASIKAPPDYREKDQFRPYFRLHHKNIFDSAKVLKRRVEENSPAFESDIVNLANAYKGFIAHYNNYIQYAPSHMRE
jgi:hypothetical protein